MTASGSTTQRKREHCILTIRKKSDKGKNRGDTSNGIEVYHLFSGKHPTYDR